MQRAIRSIIRMIHGGTALLPAGAGGESHAAPNPDALKDGFLLPPDSSKPYTWWHWMNGNITREGITKDLEEMKRVGFGGAHMFNVSYGTPPGSVKYMSPPWRDLVNHAIAEANRLGLDLSMHNCAGYTSTGGPWITPAHAMQKVVYSQHAVTGPGLITLALTQPPTNLDFYRDIAVLAFPTPQGEQPSVANEEGRKALSIKAGYERPPTLELLGAKIFETVSTIPLDAIINLTDHMDSSGRLTFDFPAGNWTILRFGYTPTGITNHPAPLEGRGLECDKLSREGVDVHFAAFIDEILADAAAKTPIGIKGIIIDSFEVGSQNWSPRFAEEFRVRRGYDPIPYLPVMQGSVVGSADISERFLWDLRRTIADLFAENYYGYFREQCHKRGLLLWTEVYGNGNFDDVTSASQADVPMGEFWAGDVIPAGRIRHARWTKQAASVAHTYGRQYAAAEAYTSSPQNAGWRAHPFSLKELGDAWYCNGINRFVFHRYAHQPWLDLKPGMTMGHYGLEFERTLTWWDEAPAWLGYLSRCQFLLQQGQFVGDICYYIGEGSPCPMPHRDTLKPVPPAGYDYDGCDTQTLLARMTVKDGLIALPTGMKYRLLALPDVETMTPPVLRKIAELVNAGATVVGPKPAKSPSLTDYPSCDAEIQRLADAVWGDCNGETVKSRAYGKGRVIWGETIEQIAASLNLKPDFECLTPADPPLRWIHRATDEADIYFVSNQAPHAVNAVCSFRVEGKKPELWRPDTGRIEPCIVYEAIDGRTNVPLRLDPIGSVFVVFRKKDEGAHYISVVREDADGSSSTNSSAFDVSVGEQGIPELLAFEPGVYTVERPSGKAEKVHVESVPDRLIVTGPWDAQFQPGWGAPAHVTFEDLISWTQHSDEGVRYYSGSATYIKTFTVPAQLLEGNRRFFLDLGDVRVIAVAKLNGKDLGILWKPPFRADVTGILKAGDNKLEIRVVNLWPNRLIGDEQMPDDCERNERGGLEGWPSWILENKPRPSKRLTFATFRHWNKESPLLPSGLLGPVSILTAEARPMIGPSVSSVV